MKLGYQFLYKGARPNMSQFLNVFILGGGCTVSTDGCWVGFQSTRIEEVYGKIVFVLPIFKRFGHEMSIFKRFGNEMSIF